MHAALCTDVKLDPQTLRTSPTDVEQQVVESRREHLPSCASPTSCRGTDDADADADEDLSEKHT